MPATNRWLQGFQYFRAIAICEVIVLHATLIVQATGLTTLSPQKEIIIAVWAFASPAVAHFVFISGAVLYNKYNDGFSISAFYKRRISSVLPPYLVFTTFYYFYPYVGALAYASIVLRPAASASLVSNAQLVHGYVRGLIVGVDHLWFIPLIIQLYLLFPLLVKLYNRFSKRGGVIMLSLLFVIQLAFSSLFLTTGPTVFRVVFLSYVFYFVFGFYISAHYDSVKQKLAKVDIRPISFAVVLATIYYAVINYRVVVLSLTVPAIPAPTYYVWLYQLSTPFYFLLLLAFYLKLSIGWGEPRGFFKGAMDRIGEDSFGIYLTHYFFIVAFALTLPAVGLSIYNLAFYPTAAFLTLISSYFTVQVLYRLPFSYITVGKPRKKRSA
jgi:peptidoglycan/LPS O-acetylase OafA/YrhL